MVKMIEFIVLGVANTLFLYIVLSFTMCVFIIQGRYAMISFI